MRYWKYVVKERIRRRLDRANMWVAWHLPKALRMWVVVRAFAVAWENPPYKTPDDIGYTDVMKASFH